jgi:hypothetical protein
MPFRVGKGKEREIGTNLSETGRHATHDWYGSQSLWLDCTVQTYSTYEVVLRPPVERITTVVK